MPNLIIIRLHPDSPVAGGDFTNYLTGLTITAYDLSTADPKVGVNIGHATYIAPPSSSSRIFQHLNTFTLVPEAVATAVIEVTLPAGYKEYVSPDLRIEVSRGGTTITDKNLYYDVSVVSVGAIPAPGAFPSLGPTSLYLRLPRPVAPGLASLDLNDDGTPPNFKALKDAVTTVLAADQQPVPPAALGSLTADQAGHIAYEIIWGSQDPLPQPPASGVFGFDDLGVLYTNPPNDGTLSNSVEQSRQQFEGDLNSYYATHNAKVDQLARFILALSDAVACEALTINATSALLQFPVNPGTVGTQTTIDTAEVTLVDGSGGGGPLVPAFLVPAEYFYVLGAQLPSSVSASQRFQMACQDNQERLLPVLSAAANDGTISPLPAVNPAQAVRRLTALGPAASSGVPARKLDAQVLPLVNDWLAFPSTATWQSYQPGDDPDKFWAPELSAQPQPYLQLVLCALTQGYQPLINAILAIPTTSVAALAAMTEASWVSLFGTPPAATLLPPFTAPGTPEVRFAAFLRYVQKFFDMAVGTAPLPSAEADAPPVLDLPAFDVIAAFVTKYQALVGGSFAFGKGPLSEPDVISAVQAVFVGDPSAQAWLDQRVHVINDLCLLAGVVSSTTVPPVLSPAFSIAEALYARGFTSIADVIPLSLADFSDALRGTVAYSQAAAIYARAGAVGPSPPPPPGPFQPINPGSLVDCIPPCYLSPLGPVEYLHQLLALSQASTCHEPFAPPPAGQPSLGDAVAARRGPLGDLAVTAANAETEIPLVDIVNENLEYLAASLPSAHGVVYDTAPDKVGDHLLCGPASAQAQGCHDPALLLGAVPEHSTPAVPVAAASAYDRLKADFSAPLLPYAQALDLSRTYLDAFATCRFETMRAFRKEITELALDPTLAAPTFQSHLWRLPVKADIAAEYLHVSPEEYDLLFTKDIVDLPTPGHLVLYQVYGFDVPNPGGVDWVTVVLSVPEFLKRTGLGYCELVELQKASCFAFTVVKRQGRGQDGEATQTALPECEPCCLEDWVIHFLTPSDAKQALRELAVFLRLWRKLQGVCGARYTFAQLCDICEVLQLFIATAINPDFLRQLAAFQMLRDQFHLALSDGKPAPGSTGADRTQLLALWVGPSASKWNWAVGVLLDGVSHHARQRHASQGREPRFVKLLSANLDPLSVLAGFDPASTSDNWHAKPASTLRFAEVLAKIYASPFGVGELLFLFTADAHLDGDDPFPLQEDNEALDDPLAYPDDEPEHALWALRRKLLAVEVSEEEARGWTWHRIDSALRHDFGYKVPSGGADPWLSLGQHFFPATLAHAGMASTPQDRQYRVSLATPSPDTWNIPPDGPFRYDGVAHQLWTQLPLRDEAVVEKLEHLRDLTSGERLAVQNLYYLPRLDLAPFACFFPDLAQAEKHLIEEADEGERWAWFRGHFALAHKRCQVLAEHLVRHVAAATGCEWREGHETAWRILRSLFADENRALGAWEDDSGKMPNLTFKPLPSGGAFAALLGLCGTGLLGEIERASGVLAWREVRGPMSAFGHDKNRHNSPVPTVLPAMDLVLSPEQLKYVGLRNGFAIQDKQGRELGGAESFVARWSGALLVEEEGRYAFMAGSPTGTDEEPNREKVEHFRYRVSLGRGQKTWVVLSHRWPEQHGQGEASLTLKRGVYHLSVELVQPPPEFAGVDDIYPQHTGFQVKYVGPDTGQRKEVLPLRRLYREWKDDTLEHGIELPEGSVAAHLLQWQYTSSLRDIRRTYQRAFKAMLFAHRFDLSGRPVITYRQSELGYMLDHGDRFAGVSYYRNPTLFARHAADFDFNFLPVRDGYHAPSAAQDQRVSPSAKREQAMADWWERSFDYTRMRRDRQRASERPLWLLFEEALEKQPDSPAQLLRHLDVDLRHASLVLSYFAGQSTPVYPVTSDDLEDDRWAIRAWHGDDWARRLLHHFHALDITTARPDLWASDDPASVVSGESETGNANLARFLGDGFLENGEPVRYADVKRLDDGLRERARAALLAYLCGMNRVALPWGGTAASAKDLSALLLLDVQAGLSQKASRIEEAISAVQSFMQRARLGLEPGWPVGPELVRLWKSEFESFRVWEKCRCRTLYKENWIEWDELREARKVEAFRFLESELRRSTLTIAVPGGLEYWPETLPPVHPAVKLLQKREASTLRLLEPAREGLGILGTPERDARPSWLAPEPGIETTNPGPPRDGNPNRTTGVAAVALGAATASEFPFWIQAAIRLGVKFVRVAAAGVPPAAAAFQPSDFHREPGCCDECGCVHPPLVDEYYFWLVGASAFDTTPQDEYYDPLTQVSLRWHDPQALPTLLDWKTKPAARLAWCRVHNGEFKQPRRSDGLIELTSGSTPDLTFLGRVEDSLTFSVSGGIAPVGYMGSEAPGFRYDMASDACATLPLVADPTPAPSPYPAGLPAYPYFVFDEPGDRLFPASMFSPALAVAGVLRCHCRFEPALKWYELVWNPLASDNTWVDCQGQQPRTPPDPTGRPGIAASNGAGIAATSVSSRDAVPPAAVVSPAPACCDSTLISAETARHRALVLQYLETLVEWSRALLRQNSRESAQQARLVLDTAARILGPCPRTVENHALPAKGTTVASFVPLMPPLNPRLMAAYREVRDGLDLIHRSLTAWRLRIADDACLPPYWGKQPCQCGSHEPHCACATTPEPGCEDEACHCPSPYRFTYLIQKANEAAAKVRELGSALLAAFDRGDAEYLASVRARHEVQLADLNIEVRQEQWRDADWQVKALGKAKEVHQTNRRYYKRLIDLGLNGGELGYQSNTNTAIGLRSAAIPIEAVGEGMRLIPDLFVGFPCEETWLPLGTKLGEMFQAIARITNEFAEIASITGSLDLTQAGWQRRLDEWVHQVEVLDIEIEQTEIQILGAERRRGQALEELNVQQRQLEQSREVLDLLRDKFTSHELYLFLQRETAALYARMYGLAHGLAEQAERAFNFELGLGERSFLGGEHWDDLHEGLLAGERLQLALQRMESEYASCNRREYELTKHLSLALHFPLQFLRLKTTGRCEIEIPEWMFDMDYPGHYMRRIKSVSLTIPCVTGPYTGVHCRLTLLASRTRVDPSLPCPVSECCGERPRCPCGCRHEAHEHYAAEPRDRRMVRHLGAREAIATSSGRNDAGLFELNFHDERRLPFEYFGAVSCWRIELPPENNYFDMDSLTDVIVHLNYTAREGGEALREAAREATRRKLPGDGWIYLDLRKQFPDAWDLFRRARPDGEGERRMTLHLGRRLFPFLPGNPSLRITKLAVLFETEACCERPCPELHDCPCGHRDRPGSHLVEVTVDHHDDDRDEDDEVELVCVASAEWPHLYHGVGEVEVGPIDACHEKHTLDLTVSRHAGHLERAFLLCRYEVVEECCATVASGKGGAHGR